MLKLGCDLDDCIVDTSTWCINWINARYNQTGRLEHKISYDIANMYPTLNKSQIKDAIFAAISTTELSPIQDAIKYLNNTNNHIKLPLLKLPLFVISHRPESVYISTVRMLLKLGLKNFYMEFSQNGGDSFKAMSMPDKAKIINKHRIDIFIEDRIDTAKDIINKTECTVILFCRPWNSTYIKSSNRLLYARSWQEINGLLALKLSGIV